MSNFIMKTYNDSYLYKVKTNSREQDNPEKRNTQAIMDFIIKAHRVEDKKSDAFRGIVEEVKRQQTSSILYTVLMMDNVKICINQFEMPRAFKVFDAKDPSNGRQPAVFIDATGIIELKNGYYVCKKIDVLCAYLFDALIYLLYRYNPNKLVNNSSIVNAALDCYVAMVHNNIEYMGIPGYSANRKKVAYIAGLFFLTNMMGKEMDQYNKNLAGKIAGLSSSEIKAYELYLVDVEFGNIFEFVTSISKIFNLKGLTLEVFVSKWMYYYGTGTHYATELLTSFLCLIVNAYTGSYIVGQRQVERSCGDSMVKLSNAIIKAGIESFNTLKAFMSESQIAEREVHDRYTCEMAESKKLQMNLDERTMIVESNDFSSIESVKEKCSDIIKVCKAANITDKINIYAESSFINGIIQAYTNCISVLRNGETIYESGALTELGKTFKNKLTDKQRYAIETTIDRDIEALRESCQHSDADKETKNIVSKTILEFMEIKKYL